MLLTLIVNLIGVVILFFIVKWFWFSKIKKENFVTGQNITIVVKNGVYQPANLKAKVGDTLSLQFLREDATPCAEMVIFPQLNISEMLPLNEKKKVVLTLNKAGEYDFTCQMGMYRGKLIVEK